MNYHILPELESFSAIKGGALSKDVANIMRFSSSDICVCMSADDSWGFEADRILVLPNLRFYNAIRGKRFLPVWLSRQVILPAFIPLLSRLRAGDVVWCHNQLFFSAALQNSIQKKNAKLVHHFHDGHIPNAFRRAIRAFTPEAAIFVSAFLMRHWLQAGCNSKRAFAVPNGVDELLFFPRVADIHRTDSAPTILFVGRLHPEKGVHVLLKAMQYLHDRKVRARCKIVGSAAFDGSNDTPYVNSLKTKCPPNVTFEGRKSARLIAEEYRAADILCCPSVWDEPFGNVNIEAMASRVPVVATRVGGIPEIAADGGVILVEPDSAESLADALEQLVRNEKLRLEVATHGFLSFGQKYTWKAICDQYQAILQGL